MTSNLSLKKLSFFFYSSFLNNEVKKKKDKSDNFFRQLCFEGHEIRVSKIREGTRILDILSLH